MSNSNANAFVKENT